MNYHFFDNMLQSISEDARPAYVLDYATAHQVDATFLLLYKPLMIKEMDQIGWLQRVFMSAPHDLSEILYHQAPQNVQAGVAAFFQSTPTALWNNNLYEHPVWSSLYQTLKEKYLHEPLLPWDHLSVEKKRQQYEWLTHCSSKELQTKWRRHPESLVLFHDYHSGFYFKEWHMTMSTFGRVLESMVKAAPNFKSIIDHLTKPYFGAYSTEHMLGGYLSGFVQYQNSFTHMKPFFEHISILRYGKAPFDSFELFNMAIKDPTFFHYMKDRYAMYPEHRFQYTPRPNMVLFLLWLKPDALYEKPEWLTQYNVTLLEHDFLHQPSSIAFFWKKLCKTLTGSEKTYDTLNPLLHIDQISWKDVTTKNIADMPDVVSTLHQVLGALQPNTIAITSEIDLHL